MLLVNEYAGNFLLSFLGRKIHKKTWYSSGCGGATIARGREVNKSDIPCIPKSWWEE